MLGDYVYDSDALPETRGEIREMLADIILTLVPQSDRMSSGGVGDALFAALDLIPDTPENRAVIDGILNPPDDETE